MKVTLLAHTQLRQIPESVHDTSFDYRLFGDPSEGMDLLGEFAGRACYQAWNLPNPQTAENRGYLNNIISQGHFSVLEHASATFYVEGVSRSLTHELVRHRHLSYSELSQRYVNVEEARMILPPAHRELAEKVGVEGDHDDMWNTSPLFDTVREEYAEAVQTLTENGYTRKRAREAARALMPNCVETKIVVTGNLRAWRDMLGKRWNVAADAEIRQFAGLVLDELRLIAPNSVQDIPVQPYGTE